MGALKMKKLILITIFLPILSFSSQYSVLELSAQTLVCSNIALLNTVQSVVVNYPKNSLRAQIDPQNGFIKIISKTSSLLTSSERMIAQISPSVECVILGGNPTN